MKLLFIHSDEFYYEVVEPTGKFSEQITNSKKSHKFENCLVVFYSVEADDDESVVQQCINEIIDVSDKVNVNNVVLYPYAHLSSNLAVSDLSLKISNDLEIALCNFVSSHKTPLENIFRAPFGWYKKFKLNCKGHPLSELSKEIHPKIKREEVIEEVKSEYRIIDKDLKEYPIELENIEKYDLEDSMKKYIFSEVLGRTLPKEPKSIKAMTALQLIDYEPASDSGHFRFYPKGALMLYLLKDYAEQFAKSLNAISIDTPLLYDWSEKDIREQTLSFHERHYTVHTPDKKRMFVLRFAGDFGLFKMIHDATVTYKQLPIRIYELSQSFRYEQSGELSGLRRLRAFHMPDIHSFTKDFSQGLQEFMFLHKKYIDFVNSFNVEYAIVFRVVKDFYEKYKKDLIELVNYSKNQNFFEILSERKHYWVLKSEIQCLDSNGNNLQLCTTQLDIEDSERYGLTYYDETGNKKGYVICHSSIGSLERWIYIILENAFKLKKPALPFWLNPIQIKLIPVSQEFLDDCIKLAEYVQYRVEIDDRDESLNKKILDAEKEWVHFIVVYGKQEKTTNMYSVRLRDGGIVKWSLEDLKKELVIFQGNYPYRESFLPLLTSKKIIFGK